MNSPGLRKDRLEKEFSQLEKIFFRDPECRRMLESEGTSALLSLTLPRETSTDLENCNNGQIARQSSSSLGSPSGPRPLEPLTSSATSSFSTPKRSKGPFGQLVDLTDEPTLNLPMEPQSKTSPIVPRKAMEAMNRIMDLSDSSSESDQLSVDQDLDEVSFIEYCLELEQC